MEWNCKTIDVYTHEHNGHEGVIYNVHWRVSKDVEDFSASSYGTQSLNTEELENFTPLSDVTEAMVQGWVEAAMGEEAVANLESNLDSQIEQLQNPTTETITLGE
tara:strand:+ start:836 stop:1150 length:315 start_codon:yes stop_codon:yes gene_type:complete